MCGIVGFWELNNQHSKEQSLNIILEMTNALKERGPDFFGVWSDDRVRLFLGYRRLSIIDLNERGAQPMVSQSGRYVIAYNGEVFNAFDLRRELEPEGYHFKGYSDTEIVLAACEFWGIEKACNQFNGMFAFAFWDSLESKDHTCTRPYWSKASLLGHPKQYCFFLDHS